MADLKARLHLRDLDPDVPVPELAFFVLGEDGEVSETFDVDDDGAFEIEEGALDGARRVVLAPRDAEVAKLRPDQRIDFRPDEIGERIVDARFELPHDWWCNLIKIRICVDGRVEHCRPTPIWWAELHQSLSLTALPDLRIDPSITLRPTRPTLPTLGRPTGLRPPAALAAPPARSFQLAGPTLTASSLFGTRCEPVCEGLVEVFQRTCCCRPWIVGDLRLPQLLDHLREIVQQIPQERPVPPIPPVLERETVPLKTLEASPLVTGGTLAELAVNAPRDLASLEKLDVVHQVDYINARPYLFCWLPCGEPIRRGEGTLRTDGTFEICWREPLRILGPFCRLQYAFKVTQLIDGQSVTIYDGLAAGKWFDRDDDIVLRSTHSGALSCPTPTPVPEEGDDAFVYLELVGGAQAQRIALPMPSGPTAVDLATAHGKTNSTNAGLLDPVPTAAEAVGQYRNRNWGGGLHLFVRFSENLKGSAKYYRLSVMKTTAAGVGTGDRWFYHSTRSWLRVFPVGGGQLDTEVVPLGPTNLGNVHHLYEIPYQPATGWWAAGQYHGRIDVDDFDLGGHVVVLELFDQAGAPVTPGPLPGGGNLHFKIWRGNSGSATDKFLDVNQPQLPHYFWFDDRRSVAQIEGLSLQGAASDEECQFLEGPGTHQVRVLYRAYHPDHRFHLHHSLTWRRGISGPGDSFVSAETSNKGQFTTEPVPSPPQSVATLLGGNSGPGSHPSCSFALALHTHVKTTNGSGTLDGLEGHDTGAFALTNTSHTP